MDKYKVLFDLSSCSLRNAVSQESSQLFYSLKNQNQIVTDGMMYAKDGNILINFKALNTRAKKINQTQYFFQNMFNHEKFYLTTLLSRFKLKKILTHKKKQYNLFEIDAIFYDLIWRNFFSKYLNAAWKSSLSTNSYYYTDMTNETLTSIDTTLYDFIIFPKVSSIKVSNNTIKIVRLHGSDFLIEHVASLNKNDNYINIIKKISHDSYFVCDTPITQKKLIQIFPEMEKRSSVIATSICIDQEKVNNKINLMRTIKTRIFEFNSNDCLRDKLGDKYFEYILTTGSLSLECNLQSLLLAWQKWNMNKSRSIKLIIVFNDLNEIKKFKQLLKDFVVCGELLILSSLSSVELSHLYSHAKFFVASSYVETSNVHLLTALYYQCPLLISDIPEHRWWIEKGAIYFDPNSPDELTEKMSYFDLGFDLEKMVAQGQKKLKEYHLSAISNQWLMLLTDLKSNRSKLFYE